MCWKDIVAVGLKSGNIVFLDPITGSRGSILSGHTKNVTSLAFSLDGTLLVSGSEDNTIKIWDIQTGGVVRTFRSGTHQASIISISPDDLTIASGSRKGEIRLWGVRTGKGRCITKISSEPRAVCFFPTIPGSLMSVSSPGKIQQWDINGKKIGTRIFGYGFAFSLDGSRFVMCGQLTSPTLRDNNQHPSFPLSSFQSLLFFPQWRLCCLRCQHSCLCLERRQWPLHPSLHWGLYPPPKPHLLSLVFLLLPNINARRRQDQILAD